MKLQYVTKSKNEYYDNGLLKQNTRYYNSDIKSISNYEYDENGKMLKKIEILFNINPSTPKSTIIDIFKNGNLIERSIDGEVCTKLTYDDYGNCITKNEKYHDTFYSYEYHNEKSKLKEMRTVNKKHGITIRRIYNYIDVAGVDRIETELEYTNERISHHCETIYDDMNQIIYINTNGWVDQYIYKKEGLLRCSIGKYIETKDMRDDMYKAEINVDELKREIDETFIDYDDNDNMIKTIQKRVTNGGQNVVIYEGLCEYHDSVKHIKSMCTQNTYNNGELVNTEKTIYDENGKTLSIQRSDGTTITKNYIGDIGRTEVYETNLMKRITLYDELNRVIEQISFDKDGQRFFNKRKIVKIYLGSTTHIISRKVYMYDDDNETVISTITQYEAKYDKNQNLLCESRYYYKGEY